jgi:hypothetical protein
MPQLLQPLLTKDIRYIGSRFSVDFYSNRRIIIGNCRRASAFSHRFQKVRYRRRGAIGGVPSTDFKKFF